MSQTLPRNVSTVTQWSHNLATCTTSHYYCYETPLVNNNIIVKCIKQLLVSVAIPRETPAPSLLTEQKLLTEHWNANFVMHHWVIVTMWCHTISPTLVNDHLNVKCAMLPHSVRVQIFRNTFALTLVKNHLHVNCVKSHLARVAHLNYTCASTSVNDHLNVKCVMHHLVIDQIWRTRHVHSYWWMTI